MQQPGEIVDKQIPFIAPVGKLMPRSAEPFGERRPRDQSLDAIAVERARAGKIVAGRATHAHMPRLAMRHALHRPAARDQPDAAAGDDRDLVMSRKPPPTPPASHGPPPHSPLQRHNRPVRTEGVTQYIYT